MIDLLMFLALNVIVLKYLLKVKPYKHVIFHWRDIVCEIGFSLIHFATVLLIMKIGDRKNVGNFMVGLFWMILGTHLLVMIYEQIKLLKFFWKKLKMRKFFAKKTNKGSSEQQRHRSLKNTSDSKDD